MLVFLSEINPTHNNHTAMRQNWLKLNLTTFNADRINVEPNFIPTIQCSCAYDGSTYDVNAPLNTSRLRAFSTVSRKVRIAKRLDDCQTS